MLLQQPSSILVLSALIVTTPESIGMSCQFHGYLWVKNSFFLMTNLYLVLSALMVVKISPIRMFQSPQLPLVKYRRVSLVINRCFGLSDDEKLALHSLPYFVIFVCVFCCCCCCCFFCFCLLFLFLHTNWCLLPGMSWPNLTTYGQMSMNCNQNVDK